ncbi:MAG: hypothetical protein ACYS8K_01995 [Planctomycetota bacterium]|jgi:ribosomal protein L40E
MAERGSRTRETIRLNCPCGRELEFEAQLLGRIISCPHCGRYMRPALQFLMADESLAPNLTAPCPCGHFIVERVDKAGGHARCKVCKSHLVMPQPVVKFGVDPLVRVPAKMLQSGMKRGENGRRRATREMTKLRSAAHAGRISLRPGENICVNVDCGALLGVRANVCPKCGTNRLTGSRYKSSGPAADPAGRWRKV